MKFDSLSRRSFLFLQGPPGLLFAKMGEQLAQRGHQVHRINLNGGDEYDWRSNAICYRGRLSRWPLFVHDYMERHGVTDLILYGDCRPMHSMAHGMAKLRGIAIHVLEEGYIRPDWMTWEPDGVNGHSTLPKDPDWYVTEARTLPPLPDIPAVTASFKRRARDSYWHYHRIVTGRWKYPFYQTHRKGWIIGEGLGWIARFARGRANRRRSAEALAAVEGKSYFLLPLQLTGDFQIRTHSPFRSMASAVELLIGSFARHAPDDAVLLIKDHPLYNGFTDWRRVIARMAKQAGIADRVIHVAEGDLAEMIEGAAGMVCVNSTSATLALAAGKPVKVLGEAVYDMPGITDQQRLERFWVQPQAPEAHVYESFRRVLHARCLVRGGLASESAVQTLVTELVERLDVPRFEVAAIDAI